MQDSFEAFKLENKEARLKAKIDADKLHILIDTAELKVIRVFFNFN